MRMHTRRYWNKRARIDTHVHVCVHAILRDHIRTRPHTLLGRRRIGYACAFHRNHYRHRQHQNCATSMRSNRGPRDECERGGGGPGSGICAFCAIAKTALRVPSACASCACKWKTVHLRCRCVMGATQRTKNAQPPMRFAHALDHCSRTSHTKTEYGR